MSRIAVLKRGRDSAARFGTVRALRGQRGDQDRDVASLHRLAHEVFERPHDVVHARVDALASRQRSIEIVRPLHQQNEVRTSFRAPG